jgi:hypothetical protein
MGFGSGSSPVFLKAAFCRIYGPYCADIMVQAKSIEEIGEITTDW